MHTLALWILPSGWAAAALEREHGVPYSVWALGSDIWTLGKLPVVRTMLKSVIRGAQGRYSDGFQLGTDAGRIAGLPFEFLPSTRRVNADRRPAPANTPPYRLMFLGRWHPNKGIDLLLDALDLLNDAQWSRIRDVHVAGGGPLESLVRARVAALAARNRPVRVSGFLDRAQAYAAIQDADWVLLPSRIESIPVVLSDAIKLCRPLVATPVGDIPRLFEHNRLGVLANAATAQGIAQAIASALHDDPASYAPGLRDAAVQFDVSRVADALARASMGQPRS
jgi:glycosyltransferase involved in cell wall biosynthesis